MKTTKGKLQLIYAYAHLPEKLMFLSNPPKDITKDKYDDIKYLSRCIEMLSELDIKDFDERKDGVLPYAQNQLLKYFEYRIKELEEKE